MGPMCPLAFEPSRLFYNRFIIKSPCICCNKILIVLCCLTSEKLNNNVFIIFWLDRLNKVPKSTYFLGTLRMKSWLKCALLYLIPGFPCLYWNDICKQTKQNAKPWKWCNLHLYRTSEAMLSISTASNIDRGSRDPIVGAVLLGGTSVSSKQGSEW